jgi:hypothetical protein
MVKLLQFIVAPFVGTFDFVGFDVSLAAASWWRHQISFGWGNDRASSQIGLGTPEQWCNLGLLLMALFVLTYFVVAGSRRARRLRLQKAVEARNVT